ncbi:MAG: ATP-dependent DNA helicase RecG, partial [Rhizobiaceae bacterium]
MRPAILDPLFASVSSLPGVGPKIADLIARVTGREDAEDCRVVDILFHAPYSLIDRRNRPGIALAPQGAIVTIEGRVDRHQPPPARTNQPYRVFLHDETGELALTFFRAKGDWLHKTLPVDEQVMVSGKVDWFNGRASMIHPDFMVKVSEAENLPLVEPVYP